jgi:hypothetical protein
METLQSSYRAVIGHVAADIETLHQSGLPGDTAALKLLRKRHQWLVCRKDRLNERRDIAISGFRFSLDDYLYQCESFWKDWHGRTYESKMDELLEVKRRVVKIYSLSGFDACYALLLALKPMRGILPLPQYDEYTSALSDFVQIKSDCIAQLEHILRCK